MTTQEMLQAYFHQMEEIAQEFSHGQASAIEKAVDIIMDAWAQRKAVYTMGNGGSASTASHLSGDLAKFTIAADKPRLKTMCLNDNASLISAWTNDSGFGSVFAEQLEPWLEEGDVIIALSVHGGSGNGDVGPWSQNLVRAVNLAKERNAKIIGLSGFGGGALKTQSDVCLVVPADQEPLGTPLVESYHVALHHLLCACIKQRIAVT